MFESIKGPLAKKLQKKALREAYILGVAQKIIGDQAQVISIKNGRLKITYQDSLAGFSLATRREKLIEQINEQLKESVISKIVIEVKNC